MLVALVACAPEVKKIPRQFLPPLAIDSVDPNNLGSSLILENELYSPARFMTACGWLQSMGIDGNLDSQGFRILEDYGTKNKRLADISPFNQDERVSLENDDDIAAADDDSRIRAFLRKDNECLRAIRSGPVHRNNTSRRVVEYERCRRQAAAGNVSLRTRKKGSIDFQNLYGRVHLNDNPLFEYGLLRALSNPETGLPDRDGFFAALDAEVKKTLCRSIEVIKEGQKKKELKCFERTPLLFLPLLGYRALLRIGILDPLKERNKFAREMIANEMPGAYDTEFKLYKLKETFPDVIVQNGTPYVQVLNPLPTDSDQEIKRKDEDLRKVLAVFARRVPMFRDNTWASFQEDMRWGLSAGIRGMQSVNPIEQACASMIFHRAFAQMLSIKGYDRPPTKVVKTPKGIRRPLAELEELLVHPKGQRLKGCRATGSFTRRGRLTQVRDAELSDMSKGSILQLSSQPLPLEACQLSSSNSMLESLYPDTKNEIAEGALTQFPNASLNQKLEFLSGMSYFMMAFAPGAKWWFGEDALVSYPLSDFASTSVSDMLASGGLMPYESFALSLGFLNLVGNSLIEEHLVYVDEDNKEVARDSDKVAGIRIASVPRKPFEKGSVVTDVRSVMLLVDVVFRLDETLSKMASWYETFKRNPDPTLKAKLYEGMFGSEENLQMLTDSGAASVRSQLKDLKLALALLLNKFAKAEGRDALGRIQYSCYSTLTLDPESGVEFPEGQCSSQRGNRLQSELELWSQAMRLVGRVYQSPLYLEMGRE